MTLPSQQLMSEVLGIEHILQCRQSVNVFWVTDAKSHCGAIAINIYEFSHKCKEWATSHGYIMLSYMEDDKTGYVSLGDLFGQTKVKLPQPKDSFWFEADTELEAIFKACEWIMEKIK